jgi:hypothetical protein
MIWGHEHDARLQAEAQAKKVTEITDAEAFQQKQVNKALDMASIQVTAALNQHEKDIQTISKLNAELALATSLAANDETKLKTCVERKILEPEPVLEKAPKHRKR